MSDDEANATTLSVGQQRRSEALRLSRSILASANVFGRGAITDVKALIETADWILGAEQEREDHPLASLFENAVPVEVPLSALPDFVQTLVRGLGDPKGALDDLFEDAKQNGRVEEAIAAVENASCNDPSCESCVYAREQAKVLRAELADELQVDPKGTVYPEPPRVADGDVTEQDYYDYSTRATEDVANGNHD